MVLKNPFIVKLYLQLMFHAIYYYQNQSFFMNARFELTH
tara:strand:+ start:1369 stop:1485 length:117 start_codon:yes stop_codon:yes gene_type:complete